MYSKYFILLTYLSIYIAGFSAPIAAATFLNDLPNKKPIQILTDKKDHFFIDFGSRVYVYSNKLNYIIKIQNPDNRFNNFEYHSVVSASGVLYSIFKSSYAPDNSKFSYHHIHLATCRGQRCRYKRLAKYRSSSDSSESYSLESIDITPKGHLFSILLHNVKTRKGWKTRPMHYYGSPNRKFLLISNNRYNHLYVQQFPNPNRGVSVKDSKRFGYHFNSIGGTDFMVSGKPIESGFNSRGARRVIWDRKGNPHIFFHNPSDRQFYHFQYSSEDNAIDKISIDHAESGYENLVFIKKDELWSLHYFYRNPFNKGLLVTVSSINGEIKRQFIFDSSKTRNSGWDLVGGQSSKGRVLFSYLSNKQKNEREFVLLKSVHGLEKVGKLFQIYGHPKGQGHLKAPKQGRAELVAELASAHLQSTSMLELNVGVGVQQLSWSITTPLPDHLSGISSPYRPRYKFSDSSLRLARVDGRYGDTKFVVTQVSNLLNTKLDEKVSPAQNNYSTLQSLIEWKSLFFDYDVQLQVNSAESRVSFSDLSGQVAPKTFDLKYQEIKLSLLTFERHHFGLAYQTYNFYQPIYIYKAPTGSRSFSYFSQAIGDVQATNLFFHYGSTTTDYLVKYETQNNDWFFDQEWRLGMAKSDYNGDLSVTGNQKPTQELTLAFAGQLEFGKIWYKRWETLLGAGGIIKLSYQFDFTYIGNSSKPDDLSSAATSDQYKYIFERTELKHGPMLYVSFNF